MQWKSAQQHSLSRFIAVASSFLPSRSLGQGRTKPAGLGICERCRGGERSGNKPLSSARYGLEIPGTVLPETRQIEGLAAEALSGSPAGLSVRTPAGLAELTSTCPETHARGVDG
ncbi:unnamed protein product [Sphagnum tenellum]